MPAATVSRSDERAAGAPEPRRLRRRCAMPQRIAAHRRRGRRWRIAGLTSSARCRCRRARRSASRTRHDHRGRLAAAGRDTRRRRASRPASTRSRGASAAGRRRCRRRSGSAARSFSSAFEHDPIELRGSMPLSVLGGAGSRLRMPSKTTAVVWPGKLLAAGGHLVEHDAEREQVGARIDILAARLLGRHVGDGADVVPTTLVKCSARARLGGGAALVGRALGRQLGQAEVEHLHLAAAGDEDVGRLDVAMDDAFACAASSASAICMAMSSSVADRADAPRASRSSGSPSSSSIAMNRAGPRARRSRRSCRCSGD